MSIPPASAGARRPAAEVAGNPRAASARLRAARKLAEISALVREAA